MAEYFLRIIAGESIIKRMEAEDDDAAMKAAIRWEGHNADMDLTCGVRRVALRRKSVWYLRPDADFEVGQDEASRRAVDDFTKAAGWTGEPHGKQQPTRSSGVQPEQAPTQHTSAIRKLLELLQRLD